jgi:hypothetical protein
MLSCQAPLGLGLAHVIQRPVYNSSTFFPFYNFNFYSRRLAHFPELF